MIKVSVIIPTYNPKEHLIETLLSVLNQTYSSLEIVIVDDGSSIDTAAFIKPYISSHAVRYIGRENGGTAAARNTGINNSTGEYIAFLDHDDIWLPDKIALQVEALDRNPSCGLTYCNFQILDEQTGSLIDPRRQGEGGCMFEKFLYRNFITTASQIMVRRSCFDQLGLFDESLPIVDDYDFYLRLSRCYDINYDSRVLTHWRSHQFNTSKNYEKTQLGRIKVKEAALNRWVLSNNQKRTLFGGLRSDYYELAYYYLTSEKYSEARNYFKKAVPYKLVKSMVYYLSTCVPGLSYRNLKALKNDLSK